MERNTWRRGPRAWTVDTRENTPVTGHAYFRLTKVCYLPRPSCCHRPCVVHGYRHIMLGFVAELHVEMVDDSLDGIPSSVHAHAGVSADGFSSWRRKCRPTVFRARRASGQERLSPCPEPAPG